MNKKKLRWIIPAIIAGALCYRLFFYSSSPAAKQAAGGIDSFPYPTDRLIESNSDYLLKEIEAGRIDLAVELVRLRRDCADEVESAAECNERIKQLIQNLPGKDKDRLLAIFDQYLQFEDRMRQNPPENFAKLDYAQKYKLMKKARRDFFGEEGAKLIFGLEEARIALQEEQQKFNTPEYTNLPTAERMRLYEERKKETLGNYYQSMLEREPPEIKYGTELMLSQTEIAKMSEADRAKANYDLRVKYFGNVQADRITQEEKVQNQAFAESNAKMDQFLNAERDFIKNNAGLSEEDRRAGIEDLRKKILGK